MESKPGYYKVLGKLFFNPSTTHLSIRCTHHVAVIHPSVHYPSIYLPIIYPSIHFSTIYPLSTIHPFTHLSMIHPSSTHMSVINHPSFHFTHLSIIHPTIKMCYLLSTYNFSTYGVLCLVQGIKRERGNYKTWSPPSRGINLTQGKLNKLISLYPNVTGK